MRFYSYFIIVVVLVWVVLGCARTSSPKFPALPSDWLIASSQSVQSRTLKLSTQEASSSEGEEWKNPSVETDEKIKSIFSLQGAGLDRLIQSERMNAILYRPFHGGPGGVPGEAPWHLSNFVAEFGVTVQGIFGSLVSDGGFAVKGIWSRVKQEPKKDPLASPYSVQWNTEDSRQEQLAPVIESALSSGRVKSEKNFRESIDQAAARFERIVKTLEAAPPVASGWEVSRFALVLTVDASGRVSPAVSVGGELTVRLDWDRPRSLVNSGEEAPTTVLSEQDQGFIQVVRALGAQMGAAQAEFNELEGQGIHLENFHVGVAIGASGSIALVQLGGAVDGMLYYSRPGEIETIQLMSTRPDVYALNTEIPAVKSGDLDFLIKPEVFKKGLKRAIKMGGYFARMGFASNSSEWALEEVETEFEVALFGKFGLVTVESDAHLALEFHFEGDKK